MDINPIIEINDMKGDYWTCSTCTGKDDVKEISIGYALYRNSHVQSVRLCKSCRKILKEKLMEVEP
jgi:hypothetical protein